jgi:hypothetical protein
MRASSWHATSNLVLGFARVGLIAPGWRIDARKMTPEPKKPVQELQRNGTRVDSVQIRSPRMLGSHLTDVGVVWHCDCP